MVLGDVQGLKIVVFNYFHLCYMALVGKGLEVFSKSLISGVAWGKLAYLTFDVFLSLQSFVPDQYCRIYSVVDVSRQCTYISVLL